MSALDRAAPMCEGRCDTPPHYLRTYPCRNQAKHEVGGHHVCGVHKRVAERWQAEGRLDRMVARYWKRST